MQTTFDPWRSGVAAVAVSMSAGASPAFLQAQQERRLRELLRAAEQGSAHHRRVFKGFDLERVRLNELPVSHKAELMHDFASWVTDPALQLDELRRFIAQPANIARAFLGRYTVWESSGSTGEPAVFIQDASAMGVYDALEAFRRPVLRPLQSWLDPWGLGERLAFVGATGGHFASTVSVERLRQLQPGLSHRLRGLSFLQPMDALCGELDEFQPTSLATYPSAAVLLAEAQRAGRLHLRLREVWTGGESLSATARAFVGRTFGCPVSQSYGASEFLSLAFECRHGTLHLNSDWAILEPVDARGRAVPLGHPGTTTLLTNLANHVQPLIRYDLGDRVTLLPTPCACGSHLPAIEVWGRDDDTLVLTRGRGKGVVKVVPLAVSTVLEEAGLFDFQLVQRTATELLLNTGLQGEAAQPALAAASAQLQAFLHQQGARGVHIRCSSDTPAICGRSGKIQRVIACGA
ncbi:MAG: AMP-binding protein [Hydrogenophaga sp.]|uniref:phenylacetate--CoA ligase family protein n=1 Tax=Hydrogenophaga sp. TaxID=1904254 RepID=UPI00262FB3D2|nr:AMP-binding protein [Hydrogenophaga sp.]MDM7943680.1 AMP-binding protein [Hydrogenophaga sp.]